MSGTYTIEQLGQKAVWENDSNKGDYPAILSGVEGEVLVFHDSSSDYAPPKIGDELFGEVTNDKRGRPRFRRGSKGSAPGGHRPRGGSAGKGGYSPGDIARITRSHSQEMAIRFVAAAGHAEELELSNVADVGPYMNGVVARLADWFDADVAKAEQKATESPPAPVPAQMEVPADREGLNGGDAPVAAVKSDDDIPF